MIFIIPFQKYLNFESYEFFYQSKIHSYSIILLNFNLITIFIRNLILQIFRYFLKNYLT
jgi:hypothetical protein